MRKLFKKTKAGKKSTRRRRNDYELLEDRRVLATFVSVDAVEGNLAISMTEADDTAIVAIDNGQITVNGSTDLDTSAAGTQSMNAFDLRNLFIAGSGEANQSAVLGGNFSNALGNDVQNVTVNEVNQVNISGDYVLEMDLNVQLDSALGSITDGGTGRIVVRGETVIDANNNEISLTNELNDFVGPVSLRTGAIGNSAFISDVNDIEFSSLQISEDLVVNAGGEISDTDASIIAIGDWGSFSGTGVSLGNNTSGTTEMTRTTINSAGDVELYQDNTVIFVGMNNMGNLTVDTDEGIYDGRKTIVNVAGLATLRGDAQIRLGDTGGDIVNFGAVNFNSNNHVDIFENSTMEIVGDNTARTMDLSSQQDIVDDENATIEVTFTTGFFAKNVYIGDSDTDTFNTGTLYFHSDGDLFITEDSGMNIIERKNFANRMVLTSPFAIEDSEDAVIEVTTLAQFIAQSVEIGDTQTDRFDAGWINYTTVDQFFLFENSATHFIGENTADTVNVVSLGAITNAIDATMDVTGTAAFNGSSITLGTETGDNLEFGGLLLNSPGAATVFEDGATAFAGSSNVDLLRVVSDGDMTQNSLASVNVARTASLSSTNGNIIIGQNDDDVFNALAVTLDAQNGDVVLTEDSGTFLAGINRANNMKITSAGNIGAAEFATVDIEMLLDVAGDIIELGASDSDWVGAGTLTFNANTSMTISSQANLTLAGTSTTPGALILESSNDILDTDDANTSADSAVLTASNVILGDGDGCFDVLPQNITLNVPDGNIASVSFDC